MLEQIGTRLIMIDAFHDQWQFCPSNQSGQTLAFHVDIQVFGHTKLFPLTHFFMLLLLDHQIPLETISQETEFAPLSQDTIQVFGQHSSTD